LDKSTISKALNLPPSQFALAEVTRKRIMESVDRLGYRPSKRAQALARGQTHVVGLLYHQGTPPTSGVYTAVQYAVSDTLSKAGYTLQFFYVGDDPKHWADLLEGEQMDAVTAISRLPEGFTQMLGRSRLPTVLMNLHTDLPVDRVMMDDAAGAALATEHLLELGHRRIAYYADLKSDPHTRTHFSYGVRFGAFKRLMAQAGLEAMEICGDQGPSPLLRQVLESRATAVIACSNISAICLLHAAWKNDVKVPDQLSVVCFNNEFPVAVTIPPLTTVTTVGPEMGRMAAELLLKRLDQARAGALQGGDRECIVLPERLIVRGSTAPIPAGA
jgi:LacI family transcriptional regulator